jgi:small-conductance mechanosensitive channel
VVAAAAIPVLKLRWYHALYAVDLLQHSAIDVQGAHVTLLGVGRGLAIALGSYLVGRYLRNRLAAWSRLTARFQKGAVYALSSLAFYVIFAAGVLWGVLAAGFQLSVLTVFAGVAGIGLGFGLQDIVRNFVSGLILLIERPVAVGDYIDLGDLQGRITAISLRTTAIRTRDGNTALVPNSSLAASRVTNMTANDPRLRVTMEVGVSYDTDLRKAHDLLLAVVEEHEYILRDPEPSVVVDEFAESAIVLKIYAWVGNPDEAIVTPSQLRFRVWEVFREHGIQIPFPQRDLHIVQPSVGSSPVGDPARHQRGLPGADPGHEP